MVYFFMENKRKKVIKIKTVNATKNMAEAREELLLNCRARNLKSTNLFNWNTSFFAIPVLL